MYGAINWFDETAAACGEMVFDVVRGLGAPLTPEIASAIYVAILTDTGAFHHANITARTFDICRQFADAGVSTPPPWRPGSTRTAVMGKLRLTGALLDRMTLEADGRVAVLQSRRRAAGRRPEAPRTTWRASSTCRLAAGPVQAVVLFKDFEDALRVSVRSKGRIDVRAVAVAHGGGGHRNAAGFSLAEPVETASRLEGGCRHRRRRQRGHTLGRVARTDHGRRAGHRQAGWAHVARCRRARPTGAEHAPGRARRHPGPDGHRRAAARRRPGHPSRLTALGRSEGLRSDDHARPRDRHL